MNVWKWRPSNDKELEDRSHLASQNFHNFILDESKGKTLCSPN